MPCFNDAQCSALEMCHPLLRTCLPRCTSSADCPNSQKTCATASGLPPNNDAGVPSFCQCATDALCDVGTAGYVCHFAARVCAPRCLGSGACPAGTTCDTLTGRCDVGGGATDAGAPADAGTTVDAGTPCTFGSCAGMRICNPPTGACVVSPACVTANPQPDSCAYGLVCGGSGCAEAPRSGVGCANFAAVTSPTLWNPVGLTSMAGPVTVSVANRTDDTAFCTNVAFSGASEMYAAPLALGGTNFPASGSMLPPGLVNYVRTDGTIFDVLQAVLFRPSGYLVSNGNRNLTLNFTLCANAGAAVLPAGFYCQNGNAVCVDLN